MENSTLYIIIALFIVLGSSIGGILIYISSGSDGSGSEEGSFTNTCDERDNSDKCPNTLQSNNKRYKVKLEEDGILKLYKDNNRIWQSNNPANKGKAPYRSVMQKDGNYVIYDADNKAMWASNTMGRGQGPYKLIMQEDGNLVLYKENAREQTAGYATWSTNTHER